MIYLGKLVELAATAEAFANPRHPYTVALLSAIPDPDPRVRKKRLVLKGDVPSPAAPPSGCRFHTRCWLREQLGNPENCSTEDPPFRELASGHLVACHYAEQVSSERVTSAAAKAPAVVSADVGDVAEIPFPSLQPPPGPPPV